MTETWAQLPPLPVPTTTTTEPEPSTTTTTTTTTAPPPETTVPPSTDTTLPAEPVPTFTVPSVPGPSVLDTTTTTAAPASVGPAPGSVAEALDGVSAVGFGVPIVTAGLLTFLTARARPGRLRMQSVTDPRRRLRLVLAAGCIAMAAIVGLIGWLKLSDEPQVNRQIPYLASAGMALVVLSAVGGSLLVAEQLRSDDRRIEELEESVRQLAETLAPLVESPPRRAE